MQFSQLPHLWRIAKVDTAIWLASFASKPPIDFHLPWTIALAAASLVFLAV